MTFCWRAWPNLFWIYLLLGPPGVLLQQFQLEPLTSTVLQGSDVQFRATVDGTWRVMTWNVRGLLVLTVLVDSNITSSPGQFSAAFCSSGSTSCVDFIIHNVTRRESGPVICTVQGEYGSKTAQLNVQESGTVSIIEGNMTVMQDQRVEFQCITTAWFPAPTINWTRNDQHVDSSLYNTTNVAEGDSYNSTSILQFTAVTDTTVKCLATVQSLRSPQTSSVFLAVVPKPPDWTVLIAVVVSFGGCALLVLLIIGIIFCCKRRKEKQPSYQDEMSRRVKTQSQTQGQVNAGYVPEGPTSAAPGELTDHGFYQANGSNAVEMSHVTGTANNTVDESGVRKHRHVTIV